MQYQLVKELTKNFYKWEQRGRGWDVWEYLVELEPPFVPFYYHMPTSRISIDDGYTHTFLSSLASRFKKKLYEFSDENSNTQQLLQETQEEVYPDKFENDETIKEISIVVPQNYKTNSEYIEQCLLSITVGSSPVSFEIVGTGESIIVQFACRESDTNSVRQQLHAFFPECFITEKENSFFEMLLDDDENVAVVDFGLSEEFMRPLRIFKNFDPDPLTSVFGVLDNLYSQEIGIVQILFKPAISPWVHSIFRSVSDNIGGSFFVDAPEMMNLAYEKCKYPLFAVTLRVTGRGASQQRSWEIVQSLARCFNVFNDPHSNKLIPLTNHEYQNFSHVEDVILRQSHRTGMLLNNAELVSLLHFPSSSVIARKLRRQQCKNIEAPSVVVGNQFIIGENVYNGRSAMVSLSHEQRLRHMHILGATGTGKSTLLLHLITQDIQNGLGVAVLDPHGDLIDSIIERMPENRYDDVILFDPGDVEYSVGFNILEAQSEIEKTILASDLVEIFRRFSSSWGDRMRIVFGNAVATLLESDRSCSLMDLRRFLIEKEYREEILSEVKDSHLHYFWKKDFPFLEKVTLSSILTRLDSFTRPKVIRNIISQQHGIDLKSIVDTKKILLIKLAQGIIGEENAYLLGSLLVAKMHQVVLQRQLQKSDDREPFYFYVDEFQNFIMPSMKAILTGARKYHFGLILAHQDLQQLWESDTALANSLLSNAGTRIYFRVGDFDAQKLESGFTHFDRNDLQNLSTGEAIVRVGRADHDFNVRTFPPTQTNLQSATKNRETVISLSRKKYGSQVSQVNEESGEHPVFTPPSSSEERLEKEQRTISKISLPKIPRVITEQKNISYHRYLQSLIKRMAEQRGYKATIEEPTTDGLGRVDVGLERDGEKIACEVSITTNNEHELKNIEKCFQSGFNKVLFCSPEKKRLDALRKMIMDKGTVEHVKNIFLIQPEELFSFFEEKSEAKLKKKDTCIVKGYRVKVAYTELSEVRKREKQEIVNGVIVRALRRLKGNNQKQ